MKLYRFKTRTTSYFFPKLTKQSQFIYSLYGNYSGKLAHSLWWIFTHCGFYRKLQSVDSSSISSLSKIETLLGASAIYGVNLGTPGPDQKNSILGFDAISNTRFFAKFSEKERAKELSKNEIKVYQVLADTGLVPKLYDYKINDDFVFLKCECLSGKHVHNANKHQIMSILKTLRDFHYSDNSAANSKITLKTCFVHHDFCPWNMIDVNGSLRIIDWEMAAELPWGYDLFTYLLQTEFLTGTGKPGLQVIQDNKSMIAEYFEALDWKPYLKAFVDDKVKFFSVGQNDSLLTKFKELQDAIS